MNSGLYQQREQRKQFFVGAKRVQGDEKEKLEKQQGTMFRVGSDALSSSNCSCTSGSMSVHIW